MLEKTLQALHQLDDRSQFKASDIDQAEINELMGLLSHLVYAPPALHKAIEQQGAMVTRSDFYSNIPTVTEIESSFQGKPLRYEAGLEDEVFLREFLKELIGYAEPFRPPIDSDDPHRFGWKGGGYSFSDAMSHYAMIKKYRPKTIVEIGCGASSLIARQALAENGSGRLVCIEPYPSNFISTLPDITLIQSRAQDIDAETLNDLMADGDFLFIDTTHTVKHNSDCLHIYLKLLPAIRHDIYVHAHDIYLPNPMPPHTMLVHQCFWTEQYLLYAYLLENRRVKILYGSAYHNETNPELLEALMHGRFQKGGAAFWFAQTANRSPERANTVHSAL